MKNTLHQLYLRKINEESINDMKENFHETIPSNSSLYSQIRTTLNRNTKQNSIISGENPICSNRFDTFDASIEPTQHRSKSRQTSIQVNNTGSFKPIKKLQHNSRNNNIIDLFSKAKTLFSIGEFRLNQANKTIDYSSRKKEIEINLKKTYQQFCKNKTYKAYLPSRKFSSNGIKAKKDYFLNTSQKNCKSSMNNYLCNKNINSNNKNEKISINSFPYNKYKQSAIKLGSKNTSELYEIVDILQQMNIDFEKQITKVKNEKKKKAEEKRLENHPKIKELREKMIQINDQYTKENYNLQNLEYLNKDLKTQYNQILNEKKELIKSNEKLYHKNQIQIKLVLLNQLEEALTKRKLDYEKYEKKYHELKDYRKENGDKDTKNYDDLFVGDTIKSN